MATEKPRRATRLLRCGAGIVLRNLTPTILVLAWMAGAPAAAPLSADALQTVARDLVNEDRRQHGLAPLRADDALMTAAQRHAEDMLARGYFAHESPDGDTPMDRFVAAGGSRWQMLAENIGNCKGCGSTPTADDVRRFEQGWMNSPEHRANILDPGLESFGFGIAAGGGRQYAVQTVAGPGSAPSAGGTPKAPPLPVAGRDELAVALVNRMRDAEGALPLRASPALTAAAETLLRPLTKAAGPQDLQVDSDALYAALPETQRQRWRELTVIAGACGGCGSQPTAADLQFFTRKWAENPRYRSVLLEAAFTDFGFALIADGQGRKTAVVVLGQRS